MVQRKIVLVGFAGMVLGLPVAATLTRGMVRCLVADGVQALDRLAVGARVIGASRLVPLGQDANATAGEGGHNPMPGPRPDEVPGPTCWCGRSGCLETFLSGPALAADHHRHNCNTLSAPEVAESAAAGDPECCATLERYMDRLARGLASVINVVDPDTI